MNDQAKPVSRHWRRFLRFSVRGMIVLVFVVGLGLGWIVHQANIQRDAVAAIKKAGGRVTYSREPPPLWTGSKVPIQAGSWAPIWVVDTIGVDFFDHVTDAYWFGELRPDDRALVEVERLNQLESLSLAAAPVTDAGMVHLKGLANLSVLHLAGTQVSDARLAHLTGLANLTALSLAETQVTDAGLVHLEGLMRLSRLVLARTEVTDAGLLHLKGLTNLSTLWLHDTRVTDDGVKELQQALPKLMIYR